MNSPRHDFSTSPDTIMRKSEVVAVALKQLMGLPPRLEIQEASRENKR